MIGRWLSVAFCVLGLVACTTDENSWTATDSQPPESTRETPAEIAIAEIVRVLAGRVDVARENGLIQRADNRLVNSCTEKAGFQVEVRDFQRDLEAVEPIMEQRREWGYYLSLPPGFPPNESVYDESDPVETERYDRVVFGDVDDIVSRELPDGTVYQVRVGGCRATVIGDLYGSVDDYLALSALGFYASAASDDQDPAARSAAERAWADCMQDRGYDFSIFGSAYQAMKAAYAAGATQDLKRREIDVATADGECALESGIVEVAEDTVRAYVEQLGDDELAPIRHAVEVRARALEKAPDLLARANDELGVS